MLRCLSQLELLIFVKCVDGNCQIPNKFICIPLKNSLFCPIPRDNQGRDQQNLKEMFETEKILPCEQRLHFRCVSCRAKSSLCRQPFKSVQKSGRINYKKQAFFPFFITGFEHWVSFAQQIRVVAIFLFPGNSRHLTTDRDD